MQATRPFVRLAVDEDFREIAKEYVGEGTNPLNPFSSVGGLKQIPRDGFLVAEVGGAYAGFLYWFSSTETRSDGGTDRSAHIAEVKVRKEFWNRKVGETLLSHALKDIDKQEIPALFVSAPEANNQLHALYEKIGFSTFARTLHMRYLYPRDRHRTQRPRDEARELAVLLVELREQCRMFMSAYSELKEMISKGPPLDLEGRRVFSARVWSRIQATLASCSVISRILWPNTLAKHDRSDQIPTHRGRELRQIIKLRGASPFPIAVRNAFEHIDEKIIAWLPEQEEDIPWGWSLSPFEKDDEPKDSGRALRYFNIVTEELRVADARCNLREVMQQVGDIETRLPAEAQIVFGQHSRKGA